MPINKFNGDGFQYALEHRQETKRERDLQIISDAWGDLSYWRKKRIMIFFFYCQVKMRLRKAREHVRAVIVPAMHERLTWGQIYSSATDAERVDVIVLALKKIQKRKRREYVRAVIVPAMLKRAFILLLCLVCFI